MMMSDNMRGVLFMNIAMLTFTLNDSFMKAATQTMPLFQAVTLRGVLTTAALLVIGMVYGGLRPWPARRDMGIITLRTLADVAATVFFLVALTHMPLANLSAIMQSLPLAVTLGAALVFKTPLGWRRMTAILIGFLGVMLIIKPGSEVFNIWSVMGLLSVATVVVRDLSTKALSSVVPSVLVSVAAGAGVTLMGVIGSIGSGWHPVSGHEMALILGSSVFLVIGYLMSVMVMRVGDISMIAPFRYTSLLWAILLGWLVFGNLPDHLTLLGASIVIAMGSFTFWRERQLAQRVG